MELDSVWGLVVRVLSAEYTKPPVFTCGDDTIQNGGLRSRPLVEGNEFDSKLREPTYEVGLFGCNNNQIFAGDRIVNGSSQVFVNGDGVFYVHDAIAQIDNFK